MATLAYITIQYSTHSYKATVQDVRDLETYLSNETRNYRITGVEIVFASAVQEISDMLNRISHFGNNLNQPATIK